MTKMWLVVAREPGTDWEYFGAYGERTDALRAMRADMRHRAYWRIVRDVPTYDAIAATLNAPRWERVI